MTAAASCAMLQEAFDRCRSGSDIINGRQPTGHLGQPSEGAVLAARMYGHSAAL